MNTRYAIIRIATGRNEHFLQKSVLFLRRSEQEMLRSDDKVKLKHLWIMIMMMMTFESSDNGVENDDDDDD